MTSSLLRPIDRQLFDNLALMPTMPTIQKNVDRREKWIAEATSEGKKVQAHNELKDEGWQTRLYVDGKDCNVQVREVEDNRMWIHVGNNYIK